MPSYQISLTPSRRAAARFVLNVRRALQKALVEEAETCGLNQSEIARAIGVHRSVINREIRGHKDITLGRVAELAHAMGRKPVFELPRIEEAVQRTNRSNISALKTTPSSGANVVPTTTQTAEDKPRVKIQSRAA